MMNDPESILAMATLIAILFFCVGAFILHWKLKNRSSTVMLVAMLFNALWLPIALVTENYVTQNYDLSENQQALNWLYLSTEFFVPSVLILALAISFLLSVRSLGSTPNKNIKDRPAG